jgi:phosphinothricin acetyltransferase
VIRSAAADDADGICSTYNHYVETTVITFEELPVSTQEMVTRIADAKAASLPWLVKEERGRVVGYAYATKWKTRAAYRHSVETTIYIAPDIVSSGVGTALYQELLARLREIGIHVAIGGVALANEASVALHEKLGFRKVAEFYEVGFKFNRWVDVAYWEVKLSS